MEKKLTLKEDLLKELAMDGISAPEAIIEEFELLTINDETPYLAREIAKKVKDRITSFTHLIEELLQPDSSLASMNECSFFDEKELTKLVQKYRELMILLRRHTKADVEGKEEAYRAFLKESLPVWNQKREWLRNLTQRLHDGWKKEQPLQHDSGYFG